MLLNNPRAIVATALALLLGLLALTSPSIADHIDGHNDSDPVWPVPLPGQDVFDGGAILLHGIGPYGGTEITNTELTITYVSDGATPASDIYIAISYLSATGFLEYYVTGADLGFGSGAGTFVGTISTDMLNGITTESFLFPPYSEIFIEIGAITGGINGVAYFEDSFINFDVGTGDEEPCDGDANGDGTVDPLDSGYVLARFGCPVGTGNADCDAADVNADGAVNPLDSGYVLARFGECS